jgi:hypothetical protein
MDPSTDEGGGGGGGVEVVMRGEGKRWEGSSEMG